MRSTQSLSVSGDNKFGVFQDPLAAAAMSGSGASWSATVDYFGSAVSISGDRVIAASRCDDHNGPNAGAAYIVELP
jgi:FG-GAP repeat protein